MCSVYWRQHVSLMIRFAEKELQKLEELIYRMDRDSLKTKLNFLNHLRVKLYYKYIETGHYGLAYEIGKMAYMTAVAYNLLGKKELIKPALVTAINNLEIAAADAEEALDFGIADVIDPFEIHKNSLYYMGCVHLKLATLSELASQTATELTLAESCFEELFNYHLLPESMYAVIIKLSDLYILKGNLGNARYCLETAKELILELPRDERAEKEYTIKARKFKLEDIIKMN